MRERELCVHDSIQMSVCFNTCLFDMRGKLLHDLELDIILSLSSLAISKLNTVAGYIIVNFADPYMEIKNLRRDYDMYRKALPPIFYIMESTQILYT